MWFSKEPSKEGQGWISLSHCLEGVGPLELLSLRPTTLLSTHVRCEQDTKQAPACMLPLSDPRDCVHFSVSYAKISGKSVFLLRTNVSCDSHVSLALLI